MSHALVLGGTGITGRRIASLLLSRGVTVRAASRNADDPAARFDWADRATHAPALAGIDALYLVPPPLVTDPSAQIAALLALAARTGITRVVACTSLGVTFPHEPRDSGRLGIERAVQASGLAWTILRPGGFMQNFSEGFLRLGVMKGEIMSATGDGAVAMIDADDIAAVAVAALLEEGHAGATYALTGPTALTFADATAQISRVAGRAIGHRAITSAAFSALLQGFGLPAEYAAMLVRDQEAIRDGHAATVVGDVERVLHRAPGSFAAFAQRTTAAWSPPV